MRNQWKGKLWYAYGTSMTSISQGRFMPVVQKLSKMKVVNKGIPGGSLTPDGNGKGNYFNALIDLDDGKKNADLITLEVLPNEGLNVGDIYDLDEDTFCGCFNRAVRFLQQNTKARIVVIIMIGSWKKPPKEQNEGRNISDFEFSEIIERVAKLNGLPVINAFSEAGFGYGKVSTGKFQVDHIHLNELGGENMGNFIWSKLKQIPTWKE